jgi:hypothetical protein
MEKKLQHQWIIKKHRLYLFLNVFQCFFDIALKNIKIFRFTLKTPGSKNTINNSCSTFKKWRASSTLLKKNR